MDALCMCDSGQRVADSAEREDHSYDYRCRELLRSGDCCRELPWGSVCSREQSAGCEDDNGGSQGGADSAAQSEVPSIFPKFSRKTEQYVRPVYKVGRVALGPRDPRRMSADPGCGLAADIQPRSFEHFAILEGVRKSIVDELGGEEPTIDAFASAKNNQFLRYWTPKDSAWDKDWHTEGLLWINGSFDQLGKITQKIVDVHARSIEFAPKWTQMPWWNRLSRNSKTRLQVPTGTDVFRDAIG